MPDPQQHGEHRNLVESVLRYIPGFHGYLEKEYRRESDQLARTWLVDQVQRGKRGLDDFTRTLTDAGRLDELTLCERFRTRLDTLLNRIRAAVQGYSGFFDFVRVDEELLSQVYDHDVSLMEEVKSLAEGMERLGAKPDIPAEIIPQLSQQLDAIVDKWDHREDLLKGLGDA